MVGARRRRQGLGPFVARDLVAAGAEIPCVLGTSEESAAAAARALAAEHGIPARGYASFAQMVAREELDALAILSPHGSHAEYLEQAQGAGLHVLCEKPLVWDCECPSARARALVEGFAERGLVLIENCQWPQLLPFYAELYPGSLERAPSRFRMELAPAARQAVPMMVDSLHHPLSCLQALLAGSRLVVERPAFSFQGAEASGTGEARLEVRFRLTGGERPVEVEIALESTAELPRPAGLGWDGGWARRTVRPADYAIYLAAGDRAVRVRDPLTALVQSFVQELRAAREGRYLRSRHDEIRRDMVQRIEALETLVRAYQNGGTS